VFLEFGAIKAQGTRTDLSLAAADILDGMSIQTLSKEKPEMVIKYHRGLLALKNYATKECTWVKNVIVLYGVTGTGKTRTAVAEAEGQSVAFVELGNGFVTGYNGEQVVIIDDFEDKMVSRNMFLRLLDRYPYKANCKGGHTEWSPTTIYITTNYRPEDMYEGDLAVQRRITEKRHLEGTYESRHPLVVDPEAMPPASPPIGLHPLPCEPLHLPGNQEADGGVFVHPEIAGEIADWEAYHAEVNGK